MGAKLKVCCSLYPYIKSTLDLYYNCPTQVFTLFEKPGQSTIMLVIGVFYYLMLNCHTKSDYFKIFLKVRCGVVLFKSIESR